MQQKVAVITGAAAGIGHALAHAFAAAGCRLVLLDRDRAGMESLSRELGPAILPNIIEVDLADSASIEVAAGALVKSEPWIDVLVNNAGIALHGRVDECSVQAMERVIATNLLGPIRLTVALLPNLKAARGVIVNMSSVFGLVAPAGQAAYAASKFGLRGFGEALGHEMSSDGVRVLNVYPAGTKTMIARRAEAGLQLSDDARAEHEARFDRLAQLDPATVAEKVVAAVGSKKTRLVIGRHAQIADLAQRVAPASYGDVARRFAALLGERFKAPEPKDR